LKRKEALKNERNKENERFKWK